VIDEDTWRQEHERREAAEREREHQKHEELLQSLLMCNKRFLSRSGLLWKQTAVMI